VSEIERINKEYYDNLYQGNSPWRHLLRAKISFDQQAKSKPNWYLLRPYLQQSFPQGRLLDFGSGWGSFLLKVPRSVQCYCFDISFNSMMILQRAHALLGKRVHFARQDETGALSPAPWDIIVCSHVLEHVPDDLHLLQIFSTALQPAGYLLINVPINERWPDEKHVRFYTMELVLEKIKNAGFEIIEALQVDKWSSFLLFREQNIQLSFVLRKLLRIWRLFLAIIPYRLLLLSEKILLQSELPQQAVILARKKK
jgi:2-polyprenyl-3-methyl-5-hydroxy-6-metoxy-1,4-benzoquinol methylase